MNMPTSVELVPGKLYACGGNLELDGRTSWAPADAVGYQPMQCYVLVQGENALIVDPGPAMVERAVVAGVCSVVPEGAKPSIFLTRYQLDGIGNLGAIAAEIPLGTIYTGGIVNPFDSFDQIASADGVDPDRLTVERYSSDETIAVGASRALEIVVPMLRILTTFWAFDSGTRTLFTSDAFTHVVLDADDVPPLLNDPAKDHTTVETVRDHLLATFPWLAHADMGPITTNISEAFEAHDVQRIAPDRGCVIEGSELVARHRDLVLEALASVEEEREWETSVAR